MDKTEISNIHYLEFLYYIERDSTQKYFLSLLPDSSLNWNLSDAFLLINKNGYIIEDAYRIHSALFEIFENNYYKDYPVVGLSFFQASEYCKWRSDIVTINNKLNLKAKKTIVKYKYSLPSLADYYLSVDSTFGKQTITKKLFKQILKEYSIPLDKVVDNLISKNTTIIQSNGKKLLIKEINYFGEVKSNKPNSKGLYHTFGNVSEMTNQEGISFGGSWLDDKFEIKNKKVFNYNTPNFWLGFRCACKIEISNENYKSLTR